MKTETEKVRHYPLIDQQIVQKCLCSQSAATINLKCK